MKKTLIIFSVLLFSLVLAASVSAAPDPDGLVGWWQFDETDMTATDYAGYNNEGNLVNTASQDGTSLNLSGNGYVSVADHNDLDINEAITIEARINVSDLPNTYSAVVSKGQSHPTDASYMIHLDEISATTYRVCPIFYLPEEGYGNWTAGCFGPLSYGTDYNVAVVFDGDNEYVYVDGVGSNFEDRTDLLIQTSVGPLEFGHDSRYPVGQRHMTGSIDDIRIWNFALSEEDLGMTDEELYNLLDDDNDGVNNGDDLCPEDTQKEDWGEEWGKNRWQLMDVDGELHWFQNVPVNKNNTESPVDTGYDVDNTKGCNGMQIIEKMRLATGLSFDGHKKYGPSKSLVQDWMSGQYYIGDELELQETVLVPSTDSDGVNSLMTLTQDIEYTLKVSGQACAWWDGFECRCDSGGCRDFDAEYTNYPSGTWGYDGWGTNVNYLDLMVNDSYIDWGTYNSSHEYQSTVMGDNTTLLLKVWDTNYLDNYGDFLVEIWTMMPQYIDLW